jgi:DnaJ-class molecular chaperone
MIKNKFMHPTIELCRTCQGEGSIMVYPKWDRLQQHGEIETCTTCEGSGRVVVSKKIEVTIVPFKIK